MNPYTNGNNHTQYNTPKITLGKPKAMVCTPGFIWRKWGELEYKQQVTRDGEAFRE